MERACCPDKPTIGRGRDDEDLPEDVEFVLLRTYDFQCPQ
jgi:hypothetical protein